MSTSDILNATDAVSSKNPSNNSRFYDRKLNVTYERLEIRNTYDEKTALSLLCETPNVY